MATTADIFAAFCSNGSASIALPEASSTPARRMSKYAWVRADMG